MIATGTGLLGQLGDPKVEHLHITVGAQHDVLRLDIAMDDAGLVCGASAPVTWIVRSSASATAMRPRASRWRSVSPSISSLAM